MIGDIFKKLIVLVHDVATQSDREAQQELENQEKLELAYAVLFVDMGYVDNEFSHAEHEFVLQSLKNTFSLSLDKAYDTIRKAEEEIKNVSNLDEFATYLSESFPAADRESILKQIDKMIKLDSNIHKHEIHLRKRFEKLLGVRVK